MPSFEIRNITSTTATVRVYADASYPYYRIFWRKTAESASQDTGWVPISGGYADFRISSLSPGTNYTVRVRYNTTNSTTGQLDLGTKTFNTTYDSVSMGIVFGKGINGLTIQYTAPDGTQTTQDIYRTTYFDVKPSSTAYVTWWSIGSSYDHPIKAEGQTTFYITDANGNKADNTLSMGTSDKDFTFSAEEKSTAGGIWINGVYYMPYIYNGGWLEYRAHLYVGGWIEGQGE